MNLFENLQKMQENIEDNKVDIVNMLTDAEISFVDNGFNDSDNDTGRFTIYDGLMELFEPDENIDVYQLYVTGEYDEVEEVINELKDNGFNGMQLNTLIDIVNDEIYSSDNESVYKELLAAFPIESEEVDEIVIEDESNIDDLTEDVNVHNVSKRIDYIKDTLDWVERLENISIPINQLLTKLYHVASEIESEITKYEDENV